MTTCFQAKEVARSKLVKHHITKNDTLFVLIVLIFDIQSTN